jgi:ABC-type nitrate/sulfonate/bicarbonate transport system permease component
LVFFSVRFWLDFDYEEVLAICVIGVGFNVSVEHLEGYRNIERDYIMVYTREFGACGSIVG